MPRVIVKCKYYSSDKSARDIGGMLKYIATREGVEKLGDGWRNEPVTAFPESFVIASTSKQNTLLWVWTADCGEKSRQRRKDKTLLCKTTSAH